MFSFLSWLVPIFALFGDLFNEFLTAFGLGV